MKTTIVTKLKREATKILAQLAEDHEPVLVTEHGKPAAYLVDVQTYELQQERLKIMEEITEEERFDFVAGLMHRFATGTQGDRAS